MKNLVLIPFILSSVAGFPQTIRGKVEDNQHQALIGATVKELDTQNGTITDIDGRFELTISHREARLEISYSGYQTDTVQAQLTGEFHIQMKESTTQLEEVIVKSEASFIDEHEVKHHEVITEAELLKAACCNLSESFETNASVDVSFTDAVTGSKTIQMLGLAGKYVQINRENIPHLRGLATSFGLEFVPGTWIQSIDVGKGAGTVVNGFESMTGQINLEFKQPGQSEKLYLNAYTNSFGRFELNTNVSYDLSDQWSSSLLFHTNYFNNSIDRNDDGFMDLPKSRRINLLNRYKYQGDRWVSQVGIHLMADQKAGGEQDFDFSDDASTAGVYGYLNQTNRVEVFGKTGLLFHHKPYKGWGFIYSASILEINADFGRNNYQGEETTLYGNVIFQNIIDNSFHQYKTGVSILYDRYDETYLDSAFFRKEVIPGIYYEYTYQPNDDFTLVAGGRADFHNLYDPYLIPRIHLRYQLTSNTTLRGSAGKGYRTANVIMENFQNLVSSRRLRVLEDPLPEESWNIGGSLVSGVAIRDKQLKFIADYFYTHFENQMVYDLESPGELRIYNLSGPSFAHSLQLESSYPVTEQIRLKGAYKYYDVKSTFGGAMQQVPYIPRHRLFLNGAYATKYDKWTADLTVQWVGEKRLPNTTDKPIEHQRPDRSPDYTLLNMQLSRGFRWGNIYMGSENVFDFRQDDPIIDPENPFGQEFDASVVWGPVAGRMVYAGIRFKIK